MEHFGNIKIKGQRSILVLLLLTMLTAFCKKKEEIQPQLSVSKSEVVFQPEGGISSITVTSSSKWSISSPGAAWLQFNQTTGNEGAKDLQVTAVSNSSGASRSVTLVVTSENGQTRRVTLSQVSALYPSYNTSPKAPDQTGMSNTAVQLAAKMNLGWNIGNTME
ncbi:BACON domain-containing protein [Pedobacter sp. NJ-S-72]